MPVPPLPPPASGSTAGGARAMGYYNQKDLPYYYWLAQNFAISDRNFQVRPSTDSTITRL